MKITLCYKDKITLIKYDQPTTTIKIKTDTNTLDYHYIVNTTILLDEEIISSDIDILLVPITGPNATTAINDDLPSWMQNCYSKELFKPKIITVNGHSYLMECVNEPENITKQDARILDQMGHPNINRPDPHNLAENVPEQGGRLREPDELQRQRWNLVFNGELVWTITKLGIMVYFLTRDSSWLRTIFITSIAILMFLFQSGWVPPNIFGNENNQVNNNPNQGNEQPEQRHEDVPFTLLGCLIGVIKSFVLSMFPELPDQQPQEQFE